MAAVDSHCKVLHLVSELHDAVGQVVDLGFAQPSDGALLEVIGKDLGEIGDFIHTGLDLLEIFAAQFGSQNRRIFVQGMQFRQTTDYSTDGGDTFMRTSNPIACIVSIFLVTA